MIKSKYYTCPNCKEPHNDREEEGYTVNKIKYPIIKNERKGYTLDGRYHDWDEHHCCQQCSTMYFFENGAF